MGRPYSMDLRDRAVAAVRSAGMSCHRAAPHYGVAPSTVIKWVQRVRHTGSAAPGQRGGHKPKTPVGRRREWLIERCRAGDFRLRGLAAELAGRELKVDHVWSSSTRPGPRPTWRRSGDGPLVAPSPRPKCLGVIGTGGTMTFVAALRRDRIDAPWQLRGVSSQSASPRCQACSGTRGGRRAGDKIGSTITSHSDDHSGRKK